MGPGARRAEAQQESAVRRRRGRVTASEAGGRGWQRHTRTARNRLTISGDRDGDRAGHPPRCGHARLLRWRSESVRSGRAGRQRVRKTTRR